MGSARTWLVIASALAALVGASLMAYRFDVGPSEPDGRVRRSGPAQGLTTNGLAHATEGEDELSSSTGPGDKRAPKAEAAPPTGNVSARGSGQDGDRDLIRKILKTLFGRRLSDMELLDMASRSADPAIRALSLRFELTQLQTRSGIDVALDEIRDPGSPEEALVAAEFLGEHADDDLRRVLSSRLSKLEHPDGWSLAVALSESGEAWALREWARRAEVLVADGSARTGDTLKLAGLYPSRETMRVGIAAARSEQATVRRAAVGILRFGRTKEVVDILRALARDTDDSVRGAARDELRRREKALLENKGTSAND